MVVREGADQSEAAADRQEFGIRASLDGGAHWFKLGEGLPTVAVDDIAPSRASATSSRPRTAAALCVLDDVQVLEDWKREHSRTR